MRVTKRDGVHLHGERRVVADARRAAGDVTLVTHAHADHARRTSAHAVVCSALTAALLAARSGVDLDYADAHPGVELLPSGHIPGSRAALIEDGERRVLYTGDVSTRDRGPLAGFDPVTADVLVVEATYGRPAYRFPPQAEMEAEIVDWIADTDAPLCLLGFSLGRAQTLQHLVRRATTRRLVVHPTVAAVNEVVEAHTDQTFDAVSLDAVDLEPDDVLVAPSGARRGATLSKTLDRLDPVTAGFSGWAIDESYRYRLGVDRAFPLTDHCDFDELLALARAVDPERVYTHHGYAEDLARHLASEGYDAVALKRDQRTLGEFA